MKPVQLIKVELNEKQKRVYKEHIREKYPQFTEEMIEGLVALVDNGVLRFDIEEDKEILKKLREAK